MDNSSTPRAVTIFAVSGFVIWTLLGLGAWAAIGFGGDILRAVIDRIFTTDPEFGRLIGGVGRVIEGLGVGLVTIVWAIGAGIIWGGWALLRRLVQAHVVMGTARFDTDPRFDRESPPPWARREMKDVTPPREPDPPSRYLPPR